MNNFRVEQVYQCNHCLRRKVTGCTKFMENDETGACKKAVDGFPINCPLPTLEQCTRSTTNNSAMDAICVKLVESFDEWNKVTDCMPSDEMLTYLNKLKRIIKHKQHQ